MLDVISQVQGVEETLAYITWYFARFRGRPMIKGDGFAQGIHHNVAILALGDMAFDLFTYFFV
jgi:hypothetical protein